MYSRKIRHYNSIFKATLEAYRAAVDFFIGVCQEEWDTLSSIPSSKAGGDPLLRFFRPAVL